MSPSLGQRIAKHTVLNEDCWHWTGCKNQGGYGCMFVGRKKVLAHRAAYEVFRGPIPAGLDIDHLCRNRACVNPNHLEAVPTIVNIRRGRGIGPRVSACPQGHVYTPENTRINRAGYRTCRACERARAARALRKARGNAK